MDSPLTLALPLLDSTAWWLVLTTLAACALHPGLVFFLVVVSAALESDPIRNWPRVLPTIAAAVLVFGMFRNPLLGVIHAAHALLAQPFVTSHRAMQRGLARLDAWLAGAVDAMVTYGGQLPGKPAPLIFELSAATVYFALTMVVAAVDLYVGTLLFAALFGQPLGEGAFPVHIENATGLLLATIFLSYGLVLFDIIGLAPNRLPWDILNEEWKRWMKLATFAGLVLTASLSVAAQLWMQMQLQEAVPEPYSTIMVYLFRFLLALLLVFTTIMVGWSVMVIFGVLYTVTLLVTRLMLWAAQWLLEVVVQGLDLSQHLARAVLDFVAAPWMTLKNWLASYEGVVRRLHIRAFEVRPLEDIGLETPDSLMKQPVAERGAARAADTVPIRVRRRTAFRRTVPVAPPRPVPGDNGNREAAL